MLGSTRRAGARASRPRCRAYRCERSWVKRTIAGQSSSRPRSESGSGQVCVPLVVGGVDEEQELVGSLNIYSATASAFDPFDEELMRLYSAAAGQAITNAGRWQHSRATVTQLEHALVSRSDIDMAKGALIALHGCDPREAFAKLTVDLQRRNVKLRDIALELLARLKASSP